MAAIKVEIFKDGTEASEYGYNYNVRGSKGLRLDEAVVVRNGTIEGNPTIDFILHDEEGNEYVTLITENMLAAVRWIMDAVEAANAVKH